MAKAREDEAHLQLGTVLCRSGRLTICDWVATGDWSPKRYHHGQAPDSPRISIQTASNTDGAVIEGLRPDIAYAVTGEVIRDGWAKCHLRKLFVAIRDGVAMERVQVGTASVHHGRMVAVDSALDMDWDDDISIDGLADVTLCGRDVVEVAAETGAGPILWPTECAYGWRDLPLAEAERIAHRLEGMRSQDKAFAVDLCPHTEQWRHLERLRQSPTGSVQIQHGGADLVMFYAPFGPGSCSIEAVLDAAGQLLSVIVDLERDPFE